MDQLAPGSHGEAAKSIKHQDLSHQVGEANSRTREAETAEDWGRKRGRRGSKPGKGEAWSETQRLDPPKAESDLQRSLAEQLQRRPYRRRRWG
jgi:hypothetical protein